MGEEMDHVIRALETVPEKRLRMVELAWELMGSDGKVDLTKCADRLPDINLAMAEAEVYVKAAQRAVTVLRDLPARKEGDLHA